MKRTGICPKCSGNRILHLSQVSDAVGDRECQVSDGLEKGWTPDQVRAWRIARFVNPDSVGKSAWTRTEPLMASAGVVEAYVCKTCGYTEFYTDPESIPIDGTIVRELVGPEKEGPYR